MKEWTLHWVALTLSAFELRSLAPDKGIWNDKLISASKSGHHQHKWSCNLRKWGRRLRLIFSITISSICPTTIFLPAVIFLGSHVINPPDTSIPSLQHMFSGNLPVPGCKICPLYSVSALSSSHTAALAQGQGCRCKVSHISTDSREGRKSRQIPVHNLISWSLGKEGKCIELNGFRAFFHVKHSKRSKNIFSKTKIWTSCLKIHTSYV